VPPAFFPFWAKGYGATIITYRSSDGLLPLQTLHPRQGLQSPACDGWTGRGLAKSCRRETEEPGQHGANAASRTKHELPTLCIGATTFLPPLLAHGSTHSWEHRSPRDADAVVESNLMLLRPALPRVSDSHGAGLFRDWPEALAFSRSPGALSLKLFLRFLFSRRFSFGQRDSLDPQWRSLSPKYLPEATGPGCAFLDYDQDGCLISTCQ